jgi:hypothetical protein
VLFYLPFFKEGEKIPKPLFSAVIRQTCKGNNHNSQAFLLRTGRGAIVPSQATLQPTETGLGNSQIIEVMSPVRARENIFEMTASLYHRDKGFKARCGLYFGGWLTLANF